MLEIMNLTPLTPHYNLALQLFLLYGTIRREPGGLWWNFRAFVRRLYRKQSVEYPGLEIFQKRKDL